MLLDSVQTAPTLFYSYSHKDNTCRENMEDYLALLKRNGFLTTWSDHEILPGQDIPSAIRSAMDEADIIVFLFSSNFIASSECMAEWDRAKSISEHRRLFFRIPIILAPCAWIDLLQDDPVKALPDDGKPVSDFTDDAAAWQQVYKGIKRVVESLRKAVCPRDAFITNISRTDFIFGNTSMLLDTYVFPTLTHQRLKQKVKSEFRFKWIDQEQLLQKQYVIVYGDDVSGKTALLRYLFLTLSQGHCKQERPLLIDLKNVSGQSNEEIVKGLIPLSPV